MFRFNMHNPENVSTTGKIESQSGFIYNLPLSFNMCDVHREIFFVCARLFLLTETTRLKGLVHKTARGKPLET